jgi:7-cyano-7-deazaguanine reductase
VTIKEQPNKTGKLLLGQHTPVVETYSPELLYPIPRQEARSNLGIHGVLPFYGVDQWYAYEMSWLDQNKRPVARVGRFTIPCSTPNLVESKSFKLYLNSLNNTQYESEQAAIVCIEADVSEIAGAPVSLTLFLPDDDTLRGHVLTGHSLDNCCAGVVTGEPAANQIEISADGSHSEEKLFSHLLRSLCPVTGQPDWATVWIHYRGLQIDHNSLLTYIIAYRQHQEFHEQCVERMFRDIYSRCQPEFLHIQAFYTRRGGMDISPFRSTSLDASPLPRLNRQ